MANSRNGNMKAINLKVIGMLLPSFPFLTFKFGREFLSFKRRSKKAGKIFQNELRKQGLDQETAKGLTKIYLSSSNIRQFISNNF